MTTAVLSSLCAIFGVFLICFGMFRLNRNRSTNLLNERLTDEMARVQALQKTPSPFAKRLNERIQKASFAQRMAKDLERANLKLTVPEFVLIHIGCVCVAFLLGTLLTGNFLLGMLLGVMGNVLPRFYVSRAQNQRCKAFKDQLSDSLTMLVSSLRGGYGLNTALQLVVNEMPAPSSVEFGRVLREVSLGLTLSKALENLCTRMQNDDLELVVAAITIQGEIGGNLSNILETISETIRERVRIKGEIAVMTTQQRMTGYVLTGLPFLLGGVILFINPDYMLSMFQPGWPLLIPTTALILMVIGFFLMRSVVGKGYY